MAINLTADQKDEIRRLTQKANRRIISAHKQVEKEIKQATKGRKGRKPTPIVPYQVVGGEHKLQTKKGWSTKSTPLSRSVQFESVEDYKAHIKFLRSFDRPESKGGAATYKELKKVNAGKMMNAFMTAFGADTIPSDLMKRLESMSVQEQNMFWKEFNRRAEKMGALYSSSAVMIGTMSDLFHDVGRQYIDSLLA